MAGTRADPHSGVVTQNAASTVSSTDSPAAAAIPTPKVAATSTSNDADEESLAPPSPQGRYAAAVVDGGFAFSAGMTPRSGGRLTVRGLVGTDVDAETAREAAGLAARNALAAVTGVLEGTARLRRCVRMTVYVACADGFTGLSAVADGASDALADALATDALPVRSAIGVRSLPSGAPVEVELTASVEHPPADAPSADAPSGSSGSCGSSGPVADGSSGSPVAGRV